MNIIWCNNLLKLTNFNNNNLEKLFNIDLKNGLLDINFLINYLNYLNYNAICLCGEDGLVNSQNNKNRQFFIKKILGQGKAGAAYLMNHNLVLKGIKFKKLEPELKLKIKRINFEIIDPNVKNNIFYDKITNKKYLIGISSDNFTNQTLVSIILNKILKNSPNFVRQYDAFICKNNDKTYSGYNIMPLSNKGDLNQYIANNENLNDKIMINLIKQILKILNIVKQKKYSFCHSDFKTKNIFINETKSGELIAQIADFDKSTIYFKKIRYFNNGIDSFKYDISNIFLNKDTFFPLKKYNGYKYYTLNPKYLEKLPKVKFLQYEAFFTRNNITPFYLSYDIYCLFIFLLLEENFYKLLKKLNKNHILKKIYKILFFKSDLEKLMIFINNYHIKLNTLKKNNKKKYKNLKKKYESFRKFSYFIRKLNIKFKYTINNVYKLFNITIKKQKSCKKYYINDITNLQNYI